MEEEIIPDPGECILSTVHLPSQDRAEEVRIIRIWYEAGAKLDELCRQHNISPTSFYKWRAKYAEGFTRLMLT